MAIRTNSFVNNLLLLAAKKESGSFMCYDKSTEENSVEGLLKMKHLGKRMIDKSIEPVEICPKTKLRVYSLEDLLPFVGRVIKRGEFGDVYELIGKYSDFCLKENRICLDVEVENLLRFQHLAVPKVMGLVKEWEVIIVSRHQMTLWDWARIERPTKEQVLRVLIALVGILQDFHAEGYCYNYVHPENVMIDLATVGRAPKVSVMDFDLMREIGANPFQRPIVQTSQSSGTNTKYCKCFASKILTGEGGTPQTDALSMALTIGFLVSNGVLTVRSPFRKLLDWFAGCYGNESGCSMDTLLIPLNKEFDNCSISEMEEWVECVADQKEISSLENSTSNSNDDEEEGRKDYQQNDLVKEVYAYQQKLGEINDQMSNLDDDLLQGDQELASFRKKADQDKRKNDELRNNKLSPERKFQEVQEENDSPRKEVSRLRESQLQREEDKLSTQGFEDKQKGDLEGKPQDERKHLRREAKEVALRRIRKIAQDEISHENIDKVYVPVEERQEALKEEKTGKKHKVNLEEIEEGIVKRRIEYFENIIRKNLKEEGQLRGQSQDFRENLNRNAKNMSLARITQIIEKELSEQNENVWKSDNIEKELKEYQKANSLRTDGDSATKGDDYAEIRRVTVIGEKQKGDLEGKPQDERKHLRREAKEVALRRIRKIAQDEISHENIDKVYVPVEVRQEALKEEKTGKKHKVNLEEIEEGIVKRRIEYFENIIRKNIKEEGQLRGQSQDFRENLNRNAKNMSLARITQIIEKELSEQNENVWKSDNIEKELKEYQKANSLRTDGDSATEGDDYAEIKRVNVIGEKQKGDLEGKPQDERKHLRREAKEVALRRIRKIAQDEISHENIDKVYVPVEVRQEALKEEKTGKKHKVNLEEIEEGIVKRRIEYFENIIRKNIKEEGQLRGQSQDFRENLNRNAKNMSLARITQIIEKELSEQNENVWKSDNIEKELKQYQKANSLRTDGDSATKGDDYAEIRRVNVIGEKQKGDLEGKPQDERKHLRREAKEVALRRIRKIAQDEISHENIDKVYVPVEVRQEALKEEKTGKKHKVNLEEIEEGIVKRRIEYFENIIRKNIKEEGQLRGQSQDFRENLNRNAKNMSLARITQIIEKELSEQNENVWKSDNIEKELKEYQEANSLRTDGDSATKGDDYAEIRRVNVMGAKQKGDLRREIDDIVKLQKRELLRREEESKRLDKELIEERRIRKETESEVHSLKKEMKSLKQTLLAKTGQIGDTHEVVMELADLMNQLKEEVNSDD
ncbi:trichohyalin-like [Palaemon carinicauda]|uniref:trichohyalin-like n=1 Tax=Palaemon carinicauda TaxID=392227 RepID=UPI0035B58F24